MTTNQTLIANGFRAVYVTAEQYEDGVGTTVGTNYVKGVVFYTEGQALREIGIVRKASRTDEKGYHYNVEADTEQVRAEAVADALRQANELPGVVNEEEPPADARLDVRLDADLKAWALEHGGSRLIRDLLRQARSERG